VVGQSATDAVVDAPGVKIGFELRVDTLRMARSNQPCSSSTCCGDERVYREFDLLDCV